MDERRKYPRYHLSFPIECRRLNLPNYFYTVTKDLSLGGAKVLSNDFLSKDDVLKVSLNLIKQVFYFKARITWCNRERYSDRYSAGLEFINMSDFYRGRYSSFLGAIDV